MMPRIVRPVGKHYGRLARGRTNEALDTVVALAHRTCRGSYHPYFLTEDVGAVLFVAMGFVFAATVGALVGAVHAVAAGTMYLLYIVVFLRVKRRLTGVGARSAMQDTILFFAPGYLLLSALLGQDMPAAVDALAFTVLIAIACMRVGCFLGGCCHGRPARLGVRYTTSTLRAVDGWRLYTPSPTVGQRVFPLQLVEAGYVAVVLVALGARELRLSHPDGSTMAYAVIAYAGLRLVSELLRKHRHRPTYGPLSEAQVVALALLGAAGTYLFATR